MECSNPFDNQQGQFFILQNTQQQFSLWPQQCALPQGWRVVCQPASQEVCNAWLNANWQSLTPAHHAC
ncbi:MbtH family NRPS accessory protein [Phytobacter diazotrophicus]|uniref:MbtH family protein n=1 Tax=Phytobacter diazotrophicus TaxID=395631 RepID=UPI0005A49E4F|nr:MbtH family NRPS accessory protein [Phytobacter diazotrophicus]MDU7200045.1 MbtH family NRPS accessory protein [Enterobacteriaceae bacterium]MDV2875871.1 MbtH family NRPS accessory protein [Phytobacter diazotrophicus]